MGCIALEAFISPVEFGDGWPPTLPLQVHGMANDAFFAGEGDLDAARAIVGEVTDDDETAPRQLFVYPGDRHLFIDRSLDSFDPAAADLVEARVLELLERVDRRY